LILLRKQNNFHFADPSLLMGGGTLSGGVALRDGRDLLSRYWPLALLFAWLQKYLIGRLGAGAVK